MKIFFTVKGKVWTFVVLLVVISGILFLTQYFLHQTLSSKNSSLLHIDAQVQRVLKNAGYYYISQDEPTLQSYNKHKKQVEDLLVSSETLFTGDDLQSVKMIEKTFQDLLSTSEGKDGFFDSIKKIRDLKIFFTFVFGSLIGF